MAVRAAKFEILNGIQLKVTWEGLEENGGVRDSGAPVSINRPVEGFIAQAVGNFDTSVTVQMQGSNDGTNWFSIGAGTLAVATPSRTIDERPLFIRPLIAADGAGDASDVDVIVVGAIYR